MPERSLAAVLVEPNTFELRQFDLPEVGDDEALLRVEACGICGSDLEGARKMADGPKILGHENVGIIARIGKRAAARWRLREGDRIALEDTYPAAPANTAGPTTSASAATYRGGEIRYGARLLARLWGGYSQYLYVHPNAVVHKSRSNVPPPTQPPSCPSPTASNGATLPRHRIGDAVRIQGPGQQGLACVFAAKAQARACIIVSGLGRDERRLEVALRLGADYTIDVESEDPVTKVWTTPAAMA